MSQDKAHARKRCGAKTRAGTPCKNGAMANGRCRMHGGKSTGAPPEKLRGNKNAVSTHEHESIVFDSLDDDEKELLSLIELDKLKQLDNEIKLVDIRLRRMMHRIEKLSKEEMTTVSTKTKENEFGEEYEEVKQDTLSQIQMVEDAITRVQSQKLRLIKAKHDLEQDLGIDNEMTKARLEKTVADTKFIEERTKLIVGAKKDTSMMQSMMDMIAKDS